MDLVAGWLPGLEVPSLMAAAPDVASKLLAWIMAGTGSLLLYSAYRKRSPLDVLREIPGESPALQTDYASTVVGNVGFTNTPGGNVGSIARIRMLANREIKPELVRIQPTGYLDKDAAASKARIDAAVGYAVPNVGAYRSYAEQAAAYASNPGRFASPDKSLHVVGLAIDIHRDYQDRPEVISAFTAEGWHRPRWGEGTRNDEPWHWSYGVSG